MRCPRCGDEARLINGSYPRSYECGRCRFTFVRLPSTFSDE